MSRIMDFRALLLPRRPTIQSDVLNQLEWHGVDAIRVLLAANPEFWGMQTHTVARCRTG